jgi:hypothetical protein
MPVDLTPAQLAALRRNSPDSGCYEYRLTDAGHDLIEEATREHNT